MYSPQSLYISDHICTTRGFRSGWVRFLTPFGHNRNLNRLVFLQKLSNRQPDHIQLVVIGRWDSCDRSKPVGTQVLSEAPMLPYATHCVQAFWPKWALRSYNSSLSFYSFIILKSIYSLSNLPTTWAFWTPRRHSPYQVPTTCVLVHLYHPNWPEHRAGSTSQPCGLERDHDAPMPAVSHYCQNRNDWCEIADRDRGGQKG
jgi:hypothetical protein